MELDEFLQGEVGVSLPLARIEERVCFFDFRVYVFARSFVRFLAVTQIVI